MSKISWVWFGVFLVQYVAVGVSLGQTQAQLQCERAAAASYEACLQHGIPCIPGEPDCGPHKGSPAQCLPAYNFAYGRCQPSFSWTVIPTPGGTPSWPSARAFSAYWSDSRGFLWLFGGDGFNVPPGNAGVATQINDLWRYERSSLQGGPGTWTLMGGSNQVGSFTTSSMPGGRSDSAFTVDAQGNFWLFGGFGWGPQGAFPGALDDLWEYTPGAGGAAGTWKLINGQNLVNQRGNYGTQNTPSSANTPGGRSDAVCWFDANGNFWLFGGLGPGAGGGPYYLNDVWEYSPSAGTWTWVAGSNGLIPPSPGMPVGRAGASYWSDGKGNVWIFGGYGFDSTGNLGAINDLWSFHSATGQWSLINGSTTVAGSTGSYGKPGIPSPGNVPPGRSLTAWWKDSQGNFWLFGGSNYAWGPRAPPAPLQNLFNDLWEFKPNSNTWIWIGGPQGLGSTTSPGARYGAAGWPELFPNAWLFGGYGVETPSTIPTFLYDLWDGNGTVY